MMRAKDMGRLSSDFVWIAFDLNHISPRHVHPSFLGLKLPVTRPDTKWVKTYVKKPSNFRFEHFQYSSSQSKSRYDRFFAQRT